MVTLCPLFLEVWKLLIDCLNLLLNQSWNWTCLCSSQHVGIGWYVSRLSPEMDGFMVLHISLWWSLYKEINPGRIINIKTLSTFNPPSGYPRKPIPEPIPESHATPGTPPLLRDAGDHPSEFSEDWPGAHSKPMSFFHDETLAKVYGSLHYLQSKLMLALSFREDFPIGIADLCDGL